MVKEITEIHSIPESYLEMQGHSRMGHEAGEVVLKVFGENVL